MTKRNKRGDAGFLMQGSILAIASIISRIVGLIYRIPLTATIGDTGNDYYGTAYEIYNIILLISSYSIPLAVSKLVSARMAKGHVKDANKVLGGALLFAFISGGIASLVVFFGAEFFTGTLLKTPLSAIALRVLAPTLLVVALLGVFRGFFQGLGTMIPSAISQIGEQIVNAIVSVVAANILFSYGKRVGGVLGDVKNYSAAYGAAGGTLGTSTGAGFALIFILFIFFAFQKPFKRMMKKDEHKRLESYGDILPILIMTIIIGIVNGMSESELVDTFIDGADDMVGVILVIAIARGASVLMTQTHLDNYIIFNAAKGLSNVPKGIFAPLNYILHTGLSVLVPSSSGLATLSTPIMGPLASSVGYSVEVTIMEMVAANGLVNLFTPTCGAIMGGLELAKVEYTTWLKWVGKVIVCIAIANILILTIAMIIL